MRLSGLPKWAVPAACSVVAFGAGAAVGRFLTNRQYKEVEMVTTVEESAQLSFDFDATDLDRELNKATYTIRKMRDESENLMSNIRDIAILKDIPVGPSRENHPSNRRPDPKDIVVVKKEEQSDGEVVHIFANAEVDADWDYQTELSRRDPRFPYTIHRDEYFQDELGYGSGGNQRTFTWYAGDSILTDERDTPIYNQHIRVGELKFGHGSGDPNIVYIRNEVEEEEYEIVMDDGSYQVVVLGGKVEHDMENVDIKHSRSPAKFRREE